MIILIILITTYLAVKKVESIKCRQPNKFVNISAPVGTGKTTLAVHTLRPFIYKKIINEGKEQKKKIYSNVPIIGAYKLDVKDLGKYLIRDCIVIIDEAGIDMNNRDYKTNFTRSMLAWFKKHRHYKADVYYFSQAWDDADKKMRDLATELWLLNKSFLPFRVSVKIIKKRIEIVEGEIKDWYYHNLFDGFGFWTIKNWAYFNTEEIDNLPIYNNYMYTRNGLIKNLE
ncbi:MAG: hypothetical protein II309_01080 [Bacilli bacterium]|nr:hypothetical protein [Bacilli bacterium]